MLPQRLRFSSRPRLRGYRFPHHFFSGRVELIGKLRLEAFSDDMIAIIITMKILEMRVLHGDTPQSLAPLVPVFIGHILSFMNVAI